MPHHDFYVIKVHDLEGGFSAVPGGQRETVPGVPSQWWDQRSDKVPEHQSCQS